MNDTFNYGLSFHSFKMHTPTNKEYISFQAELANVTTVGGNVWLQSYGYFQWIRYMTFNVIIVTVDSPKL